MDGKLALLFAWRFSRDVFVSSIFPSWFAEKEKERWEFLFLVLGKHNRASLAFDEVYTSLIFIFLVTLDATKRGFYTYLHTGTKTLQPVR